MLHITTLEQFYAELLDTTNKLLIVDFYATWCGPCKKIAPLLEQRSEKLADKNVKIIKVDVDEAKEIAELCKIESMPTIIFYKDQKRIEKIEGAYMDKIDNIIKSFLNGK